MLSHDIESAGAIRRPDTRMTNLNSPPGGSFAKALARQVMANRITLFALGIREFSIVKGRLPATPNELNQIGVDASKFPPLGSRRLATVWKTVKRCCVDLIPQSTDGAISVPADPPPGRWRDEWG